MLQSVILLWIVLYVSECLLCFLKEEGVGEITNITTKKSLIKFQI